MMTSVPRAVARVRPFPFRATRSRAPGGRRPFPLLLLAIQLDPPFTLLQEILGHLQLPFRYHPLAPGDDFDDLQGIGLEHQEIAVLALLQSALGPKLENPGCVRGEERQNLLQRETVLQNAGPELLEQ